MATTMGELSAADWTAELQRSGRVEFPLRRRPYALRGAVIVLLWAPNPVWGLIEIADRSGIRLVSTLFAAAALLALIALGSWQLITRRPILVVDAEGIRYGHGFMAWDSVGTAGIPTGPSVFRTMPVLPSDVWAKELRILQDNVRDLPAFSTWLNDLRPHRRSEQEPHADHG